MLAICKVLKKTLINSFGETYMVDPLGVNEHESETENIRAMAGGGNPRILEKKQGTQKDVST